MIDRLLTFVTPVSTEHRTLVKRCAVSIRAQSIPCEHIVVYDTDGRGPGWARNRGLEQVRTEFVSFIDADDWIDPEFAEATLAAFNAYLGEYIIYTDWITQDGLRVNAPECAWTIWTGTPRPQNIQTAHLVTTLALTDWWRSIGGFNEDMKGGEDTDAYLKLAYAGICGRRVNMPLFVYGKEGQRSKAWRGTNEELDAQVRWTQTYGGAIMGCCGSDAPITVTLGQQPGDVQVRPTWYGKRRVMSSMTGRDYGRVDRNNTFWMDPRDTNNKMAPVEIIQAATPMPPAIKTFIEPVSPNQELVDQTSNANDPNIARIGMAMGLMPPSMKVSTKDMPRSAPDISRILDKAGIRMGSTLTPVESNRIHVAQFVKPDTEYPSYTDFWRLVELSGYPIISQSRVNLDDPHAIYVWATPEAWPDVMGAKARCIGWDLEYAGEYTHDYGDWRGEVWVSDPHYASATQQRFVLLGSHPDLAPAAATELSEYEMTHPYDATMLGYMVERRQAIKNKLASLNWTLDYPGTGRRRHAVLSNTRLMLHVHQHEDAPYAAPLRYALAAAYHMPVISEKLEDEGVYGGLMSFSTYDYIPRTVRRLLSEDERRAKLAQDLYQYLCVEHTFASEVEQTLLRGD